MSPTLWAPYGDAIKLILTGASTETLTADQKAVYSEMLSRGLRDDTGNKLEKRSLPETVKTQEYCIDEENHKYETYYHIPDLFLFMFKAFPDWSILSPPVDLDYLNSLRDEAGNRLFLYSDTPGQKEWDESEEGVQHWDLICGRLDILRELDEVNLTHHGNDPIKLEAQKRMRTELEEKLVSVNKKLEKFESGKRKEIKKKIIKSLDSENPPDSDFIAYPMTYQKLAQQLDTSPEELAAWVWLDPENGGIAAYTNANELDPPPRFYYSDLLGEDYVSPLMECWFLKSDIENFEPEERFITGKALIDRWGGQPGVQARAYVEAKIAESRLMDYHPTLGGTRGSDTEDNSLPPLESGLFLLSQIEAIEHEDFGIQGDYVQRDRTETVLERRERLHDWYKEEIELRGERGAITRTAKREGITRQTLSDILKKPN